MSDFGAQRPVAVAATLLWALQAHAFEFETDDPDLRVRWDNTFRYGIAARVKQQDPVLLASPNGDDGDRNFSRGLISNRIDILSELEITRGKQLGLRLSGAGWYDSVYNGNTDNPGFAGDAFPNHQPEDRFPSSTQRLHGRQVEFRDAFVFGRVALGDAPLTFRLGSHALVWGESLFFAGNAIAGAQGPFDVSRLVADPTAQAKEFTLPVPQVSGQLQLTPEVAIGAYYQFRWVESRLPAAGSYFSASDTNVDGAERLWLVPGTVSIPRTEDMKPSNAGQFGVQLRWRLEDTDLGFYALRFHDKYFQQVLRLATPAFAPASYYITWPQKSEAYGVSASRTFGDANIAIEASIRRKQGLTSNAADASAAVEAQLGLPPGAIPANNNTDHPGYATGDTAHVNISTLWTVPQSAIWKEAVLVGEVAWTHLTACRKNCAALDPSVTRNAWAMRAVFTPSYRQVLPGVDLDVPIGIGWVPSGSRSAITPGPSNSGDITLGLNALYVGLWRFNLAYTRYFGPAGPFTNSAGQYTYLQSLKDRDFVSLSVRRTF